MKPLQVAKMPGMFLLLTMLVDSSCDGQTTPNPVFPSSRVTVAGLVQKLNFINEAQADDGVGDPVATMEENVTHEDDNYLNTGLPHTAVDGVCIVNSTCLSTAETLPHTGSSGDVPEGNSSVGGGWDKTAPGTGSINHSQSASSIGRFEILAAPSAPERTTGVQYMVIKLDANDNPFAWANMNARISAPGATGTYVNATYMGFGWVIFGRLEHHDRPPTNVMELTLGKTLNRVYAASNPTSVGNQVEISTLTGGQLPMGNGVLATIGGPGTSVSAHPSLSTLAYYWVE